MGAFATGFDRLFKGTQKVPFRRKVILQKSVEALLLGNKAAT